METPTLKMLAAVNSVLEDIRYNVPELPNVTVVLGAQGTTRRGQVHGHFAPERWAGEDAKHELMLSGESLQRGAVATLGTILHECAHVLAHVQGIKDTSNSGRYHNKRFKTIAEGMGISLEQAPTIGWSVTSVPEETQAKYADGLAELTEALTTYRQPNVKPEKAPTERNKTKVKIECDCEDGGVTVSKKWWANHEPSLRCADCLEGFHVVDDE